MSAGTKQHCRPPEDAYFIYQLKVGGRALDVTQSFEPRGAAFPTSYAMHKVADLHNGLEGFVQRLALKRRGYVALVIVD